jgi:hypothetical protein
MIVQSVHSAIEMARNGHISPDAEHPSVIVCGVKTENELLKVKARLERLGITHKCFQEPDRDNEFTSITTSPLVGEERKHMRQYQVLQDPLLRMVV